MANREREKPWAVWGPYVAERAWGTVREDYSANGQAWEFFPHEHARSRTYRWNEDGLGGICDYHQYLCFALSLWNGRDPFLKERMFGLAGPEVLAAPAFVGTGESDIREPVSSSRRPGASCWSPGRQPRNSLSARAS